MRATLRGAYEKRRSPASGADEVHWLGRTEEWQMPVIGQRPVASVTLPAAWWVPPAETRVIDLLDLHGIAYERSDTPRRLDLDIVTMRDARLDEVYDARVRMTGEAVHETRAVTMPVGSLRVPYDQPRGLLAAALLEPEAVDSLFAWGFFARILERRGNLETYNAVPLAETMLERDPEARAAFEAWLAANPERAGDPAARLRWFTDCAGFADANHLTYPIARELAR
jgi:hypothetical protein